MHGAQQGGQCEYVSFQRTAARDGVYHETDTRGSGGHTPDAVVARVGDE